MRKENLHNKKLHQDKLLREMLDNQETKKEVEFLEKVDLNNKVDIGLELFNINTLERNVKKYNKENGIVDNSGVIALINNCKLYNNLITNYDGNDKKVYVIYQLNLQIVKLLSLYNIVPKSSRKNASQKSTSKISKLRG